MEGDCSYSLNWGVVDLYLTQQTALVLRESVVKKRIYVVGSGTIAK